MNVNEEYRRKLVGVEEAVARVKSGQLICVGMAASEPAGLLSALSRRRDELVDVRVISALMIGDYEFFANPSMEGHFLHEAWFYGPAARRAHQIRLVSFVPNHLSQAIRKKVEFDPPQVFWGTAFPMDKHGFLSLSLGVTYERYMMDHADTVALEVSEHKPRTYGDTMVHISEVDAVVENHIPNFQLEHIEPSEEEIAIGQHVASLIEDESTLQLGIGGIPNAVARALMDRRDLGIHTEMLTDGMVDLYEAGVITNRKKTVWRGKMVGTFAYGTEKLYRFIHDNPGVWLEQGFVTNDPYIIAKNHRVVSINMALAVDLTGQVSSESLGTKQFSGSGGQVDTACGAQMSPGGKSVIALRSTAKGGTLSTIVPILAPGSAVTLSRMDVDYVVTEYGIAHLKAKSVRNRVRALVGIAHPKFRDWLLEVAEKYQIW